MAVDDFGDVVDAWNLGDHLERNDVSGSTERTRYTYKISTNAKPRCVMDCTG
jgi:hypothetical protein